MNSESFIGRVTRVDFWAVLPPGFYCLIALAICAAADLSKSDMAATLTPVASKTKEYPISLLLILFAAYLLGSIIRALRVDWAEAITPPFGTGFPYWETLEGAVGELKSNQGAVGLDIHKVPAITSGVSHNVFNFWKERLCLEARDGFEYYQGFEARARFSAGMVWAGMTGVLCALVMFAKVGFSSMTLPLLYWPAWQVLVLSVVVYLAFGFHLRRTREQEVKALVFLYIAHLQARP